MHRNPSEVENLLSHNNFLTAKKMMERINKGQNVWSILIQMKGKNG